MIKDVDDELRRAAERLEAEYWSTNAEPAPYGPDFDAELRRAREYAECQLRETGFLAQYDARAALLTVDVGTEKTIQEYLDIQAANDSLPDYDRELFWTPAEWPELVKLAPSIENDDARIAHDLLVLAHLKLYTAVTPLIAAIDHAVSSHEITVTAEQYNAAKDALASAFRHVLKAAPAWLCGDSDRALVRFLETVPRLGISDIDECLQHALRECRRDAVRWRRHLGDGYWAILPAEASRTETGLDQPKFPLSVGSSSTSGSLASEALG